MKKILLITRPLSPPWDEASKNFAYFLAKNIHSHEFHVLTNGHVLDFPEKIVQHPIYTSNNLTLIQKLKLLKLRKVKEKMDIIHFMFTPTKSNSLIFDKLFPSGKFKTMQTVATLREDIFSDEDIKKSLFADMIITYSDHAKSKLEMMGFAEVERIYPGIDTSLYSYQKKDEEVLEKFNIKRDDFVITYPGEYTRLGATDGIVDSLPFLFEKLPNAKFVFACRIKNEEDAKKKKEVVKILKQKNILNKVVFTDTFSDMPKIYNMSDVVVFPVKDMRGKFDVPLAVIEAFSCKKPVVISDIPILKEFSNQNNSIQIETGNFRQLIDAIVGLHKDEGKRKELGENAREYVKRNFEITDVAKRYEETYNKLLRV